MKNTCLNCYSVEKVIRNMYLLVLQELGDLPGDLTAKNSWGLFTGNDGVPFRLCQCETKGMILTM